MNLGLSSWTLPWAVGVAGYPSPPSPLDAVGLVRQTAAVDLHLLQIADNLPLHEVKSSQVERLREFARENGVDLHVGTRGANVAHLSLYVEIARTLGATSLRTVLSGRLRSREELLDVRRTLEQLAPTLEATGVSLALENNEAFGAREFAEIVDGISTHVGICLDTANSLGRPETLETVVDCLAPYTRMVHIKDYDIERVDNRMGFAVVGRPAGSGRLEFEALFDALRGSPVQSLIIEHWPPFLGTIDATIREERRWLDASLAFMRTALDGLAFVQA